MSAPTKLRGGSESEITKLKALWRGLSDDARSFWQELFVSQVSQAEIRKQLLAKLKVNLRFDKQLNQFRDWELEQRAMDLEAERQAEDERRFIEEFGSDQIEVVREKVLKKSYARAISAGDFSEARKTIVQDLNLEKISLDRQKFQFNAARAALAKSAELRIIRESKLSDTEKVDAARQALFGELPAPTQEQAR